MHSPTKLKTIKLYARRTVSISMQERVRVGGDQEINHPSSHHQHFDNMIGDKSGCVIERCRGGCVFGVGGDLNSDFKFDSVVI